MHEPFELVCCNTFDDVFDEVRTEHAKYGVVAIFNSHAGQVSDPGGVGEPNLLLAGEPVEVLKTIDMPVNQCLIGLPGATIQDITDIYSHPTAFIQVEKYIADHLPNASLHRVHDTAGAVADIAAWKDPHKVAIASEYAASHYGMTVLAENIQTNQQNLTRFVLFQKATV